MPYITRVCVSCVYCVFCVQKCGAHRESIGYNMSAQPLELSEGDEPVPKRRKVDLRRRHWFLTWNNADEHTKSPKVWERSKDILLNLGAAKYAFQHEVGESGTHHWQGLFSFVEAKLWSTLCNHCRGAVWAPCRNIAAARQYCSQMTHGKTGTVVGEPFVKGYWLKATKVADPLKDKTYYGWQKDIVDMIAAKPDDRKIYWFWSQAGAIGKSSLVKHLCLSDKSIVLCGGKFKDAEFAIAAMVHAKNEPRCVIFDVPRSMVSEAGQAMVSYTGMEEIKNGCFFSSKYESGMVLFNVPHVIVFANVAPDMCKLSGDRWEIKCLDEVLNFHI